MKKVVVLTLAVILLLGLAAPAFAAITPDQQKQIDSIWQQIQELRKQLIDVYVDAGQLTKEQGDLAKKNLDAAEQYRAQNGVTPGLGLGPAFCPMHQGFGWGTQGAGFGRGMMGAGFGGMMGGWGRAW